MKKIITLIAIASFGFVQANAQALFGPKHHIICYSTHPVDNSVARPNNNATALIRSAGDTLINYINRAKYSLDIALYDYVEDSTWYEGGYVPPIHVAINNAYARGVKIRWIHNPSDSSKGFINSITPNYGIALINKNIHTMARTDNSYIMHNKFVIIDGTSTNPNDPIVWTGCMNWEPGQICKDINNIIIFQDSALSHRYLQEFNQMWGDTVEGGRCDSAKGLFGSKKKSYNHHIFYIDGYKVEQYFSPQDNTSSHIISTEQAAKSEIDFEMFTFTLTADDAPLVTANSHGLAVRGMMDQSSTSYQPWSDMNTALGTNFVTYYGLPGYYSNGICHSKYVMVDPCDLNADPMILTGSHNWSSSANTGNDENTVIVHDSSIVNQYYQAFHEDFLQVSTAAGTAINLTQTCIPLGINEIKESRNYSIYPNPTSSMLNVKLTLPEGNTYYSIFDVTGQLITSGELKNAQLNTINIQSLTSGIYLIRILNNSQELTSKFIKQ